jgi:hypothetical protein
VNKSSAQLVNKSKCTYRAHELHITVVSWIGILYMWGRLHISTPNPTANTTGARWHEHWKRKFEFEFLKVKKN